MKRAKKYHLGESLTDIIKKQEEQNNDEIHFPEQSVLNSNQSKHKTIKDIMTGEEIEDIDDDNFALTIIEDLDEATKKVLGTKDEKIPSPADTEQSLKKIDFKSFSFVEKKDYYGIIIPKKINKESREILEDAFLEIINEISSVDNFL